MLRIKMVQLKKLYTMAFKIMNHVKTRVENDLLSVCFRPEALYFTDFDFFF